MKFYIDGTTRQFHGLQRSELEALANQELNQLEGIGLVLQIIPCNLLSTLTFHQIEIDQILTKFEKIFPEPDGIPPKRSHDHKITL